LLEQRNDAAIILQKYYRRHLAMKKLISLKEDKAATIIQAHWHRYVARKRFLAWKQCVIVIQSQARKWIAMRKRKELLKQRKEAAIIIQKNIRTFLAAKEFQRLKENKAAILIQTFWRCRSARKAPLQGEHGGAASVGTRSCGGTPPLRSARAAAAWQAPDLRLGRLS